MLHLLNFLWPGGDKNITVSFKCFKEPSLTCLASQSLFLRCHQQEVFTLRLQGWFIIEQSFLWFGEESTSRRNLFCCHLCFPTLRMTLEATDGKQRSSKKLSSHFGPTVRFWCLSVISSCSLLHGRSWDFSEESCEIKCFWAEVKEQSMETPVKLLQRKFFYLNT